MKKIDQLVLKSAIGPFLATFFIGNLVFLMQYVYKKLDDIVGKGLELDVIGEFVFYLSFSVVPLTLPLSVLIASIMTMGNLGENYELIALKSAGVSLLRIMRSLMVSSVIMAVFAFFFSNNIMPWSLLKLSALYNTIKNKKPTMLLEEGVFYKDFDNMTMKVERKGSDGTLYDLIIYDHRKVGENTVIKADSARMVNSDSTNYMVLELMNGKINTDRNSQEEFIRYSFKRQNFPIDMSEFQLGDSNEDLFTRDPKVQNVLQIRKNIDSLQNTLTNKKRLSKQQLSNNLVILKEKNTKVIYDSTFDYSNKLSIDSLTLFRNALNRVKTQRHSLTSKRHSFKTVEKNLIKNEIAFYQKFALAVSCIVLFFIGAPVGALVRKGGFGLPIIVSIFFYLIYYVLDITGRQLAEEGKLEPIVGMWLSTIILLPIAAILTQRAIADKQLNPIKTLQTILNTILATFKKK